MIIPGNVDRFQFLQPTYRVTFIMRKNFFPVNLKYQSIGNNKLSIMSAIFSPEKLIVFDIRDKEE